MTKTCRDCKVEKSLEDFHRFRQGHRPMCKVCRNKQMRVYYRNDKANYVARNKAQEARIQAIIRAAKDAPCQDCGKEYPHYVMDFDHARGHKRVGLAQAHRRLGLREVEAEIRKCDIVCANCHRSRTYLRAHPK